MPRVVRGYKEAARTSIIQSAMDVFSSKGYHSATMDDVARKVGVSKGAIYQYFKSKEDILKEIQLSSRQRVRDELKRAFEAADPKKGLETFFDSVFKAYKGALHHGFEMFSLAADDEKLRTILREDHEKDLKLIQELIDEQVRRRKISPKVDSRVLARLFSAISIEALLEIVLGHDMGAVRRTWVESLAALF